MLLAVIAGIMGAVLPAIAGWFAWPARVLLTYMLDITGLLSRMPHASAQYSLPLTGLVTLYVVIVCLTVVLWGKVKKRHGIITDEEAIT